MSSEMCTETLAEENCLHEPESGIEGGESSQSLECQEQHLSDEHSGCSQESDNTNMQIADPSTESLYRELGVKLEFFERKFDELQARVNEGLSEHGGSISHIQAELSRMSGQEEFRQLRRDFDVFSKRLRRIVKAEDSISAETLDAAKVPPDVLEITYAKTLNDLYAAMLNIFGDRESSQIVEDTRDKVRQFSAGVDFFRFENGVFLVKGLSEAVSSKLVSIKQIHATYIELFKILSQAVPNYSSQDFRSFVETGSREYTVQKVVSHDRSLEKISTRLSVMAEELSNLTENMQFMAELQNNQLEDAGLHAQSIEEIQGQMKNIAKAVNLHTKALKKLSKNLEEIRVQDVSPATDFSQVRQPPDMATLEEGMALKANRDEMLTISEALTSFREEVNETLVNIQHQMLQSMQDAERIQLMHSEMLKMREELEQLRSAKGETGDTYADAFSPGHVEQVILEELRNGPVTLKQLESQVGSRCAFSGPGDLLAVLERMEQAQILTSFKKGRYTYFSLRELANV